MPMKKLNLLSASLRTAAGAIIKLFLAIDQKEQKKRFKKLQESKSSAWRVSDGDRKRNKEYDRYKTMNEEMLERTDSACAPWTIVESTDKDFATVKIYSAVIHALEEKIREVKEEKAAREAAQQVEEQLEQIPEENVLRTSSLNSVDLSLSYTKEEYKEKLQKLQKRLQELHGELYRKRIPVILGFEGWDAGEKEGRSNV